MENLQPDEKVTLVMIYTENLLVRGELVTKEIMRVSIWPRSQGVPNMIHLFKPSVVLFGGSTPKAFSHNEIFVPTSKLIGFHAALPIDDPLDYDENELNRILLPVSLLVGTFTVKGYIRIAGSSTLPTSLEVSHQGWLSIYNAEISNPFLPQMQPLNIKIFLVKPSQTSFIV